MSAPLAFVTLAMNQTRFYVDVARQIAALGRRSAFISFHAPSVGYISAAGFPVIDVYREPSRANPFREEALEVAAARYKILNLNLILSHDRVAFDVADRVYLARKLLRYLDAMESGLDTLARDLGEPLEVVQELGGFIAVAAGYYAARRRGWNNTFIEPSFFQGRVFFNRNSFAAPLVEPALVEQTSDEVRAYLEQTVRENRIAIPAKDARQYRSAVGKVLSLRNIRRLVEKAIQKHVRREPEEFRYIGSHVRRHLRMVTAGMRLRRDYHGLDALSSFVYYPLHVPNDMALTIRSPEYLDQFALLDYLARNVPPPLWVAVKEHPAMVGAFDPARLKHLVRTSGNLVLLDPAINNLDVIRRAAAVVTVNSKSGAEALLLNKPVFVLGDAFYRNSGLVTPIRALSELPGALRAMNGNGPRPWPEIERYFQTVWNRSAPGELYSVEPENVRTFAASLARYLDESSE